MPSQSTDIGFDFMITLVFAIVAILFLFPNNRYIPLDRRLAGLIGSALCTLLIWLFPQRRPNNTLYDIDVQVLLVLIAIMAINFVIMRQPALLNSIKWLQRYIQHNPNSGFWVVSFISFIVSPFIMNDGLCLLLVTPVLDAFCLDKVDDLLKRESSAQDEREVAALEAGQRRNEKHNSNGNEAIEALNNTNVRSSSHDPFYFMLAIACSANIGSATTFSGNPQNIIVAQYLGHYMNCGQFFGLLIVPAIASWLLTTALLNYYRIRAGRDELTAAMIKGALVGGSAGSEIELSDLDTQTAVATNRSVQHGGGSGVKQSSKHPSTGTGQFSKLSTQSDSSQVGGDPESQCGNPGEDDEEDSSDGHVRSPLSRKVKSQRNNDPVRPAMTTAVAAAGQGDTIDRYQQLQVGSAGEGDIEQHAKFNRSSDEQTLSSRLRSESFGLLPQISQTAMEPRIETHEPVTEVLPSGALSAVAFAFFLLLIALEFVGLFNLASIFTLIAICLVGSVLLVNYYRGYPELHESGRPFSTEERIAGIAAYTEELFLDLDYNILIIFVGLFIVSGSFVHTGIPATIWKGVAGGTPFRSAGSLALITIYVAISSQLVGNVAVVYMAKDQVNDLDADTQKLGWCILAWVSTIAGNLTLTGSAANIIVAEKAARHRTVPVLITPQRHLYLCCLVTMVCIALGVIVIYLESQMGLM